MVRSHISMALICLVLPTSGCAPPAQATPCPSFAQVRVSVSESSPRVDLTLGRAQITEMLRSKSSHLQDLQGLGVTLSSFSHNSQINMRQGACPVAQAEVELKMPVTTVYVANEFRPGTCKYNAVLDHEMHHVAINHEGLKWMRLRTEGFLNRELPALFQGLATDVDIQKTSERFIDEKLAPFLSNEFAKLQARQDALDTPEEYARLSFVCEKQPLFLVRQ